MMTKPNCYSAIVASDFHLMDPFSRAQEEGWRRFTHLLGKHRPRYCILNGDIFEARDRIRPLHEVIDRATGELSRLSKAYPTMEIIYVLGNHDRVPEFVGQLETAITDRKLFNVTLASRHFQLGNAVFLHGDFHIAPYRTGQPKTQPLHIAMHKAVVKLCATTNKAHWFKSPPGVLHAIEKTLAEHPDAKPSHPFTDVFSGHIHQKLIKFTHPRLKYRHHNTGSAFSPNNLNILQVDIDKTSGAVLDVEPLTQRLHLRPEPNGGLGR